MSEMVGFSPDDAARIARAVKRVEAALPEEGPAGPISGTALPPVVHHVRITSTSLTSGRYPGKLVLYDASAAAGSRWSDGADVWVETPNGETLATGTRYEARGQGYDAAKFVYVPDAAGLTVQEVDGSPSYTGITTIQVPSGSSSISNPSAGVVNLLAADSVGGHGGIISTGNQYIPGAKFFAFAPESTAFYALDTMAGDSTDFANGSGRNYGGLDHTGVGFGLSTGEILSVNGNVKTLSGGGAGSGVLLSSSGYDTYFGVTDSGAHIKWGVYGTTLNGDVVSGGLITTIGSTAGTITIGSTAVSGGSSGNLLGISSGTVSAVDTVSGGTW